LLRMETTETPHPRRVRRWSRPFASVPTFSGNWMAALREVLTITGIVLVSSTFASALIFSGNRMAVLKVGPKSIGTEPTTSKHTDLAGLPTGNQREPRHGRVLNRPGSVGEVAIRLGVLRARFLAGRGRERLPAAPPSRPLAPARSPSPGYPQECGPAYQRSGRTARTIDRSVRR
jgi:hypothetical protein